MKLRTFVELGRISNLPTVWSNVLSGGLLAAAASGSALPSAALWWLLVTAVAASAFYWGGMLLNDAFDAPWDAQHRPERPIPSGRARRESVFTMGFALLLGGLGLLAARPVATGEGQGAVLAGLGAVVTIIAYDRFHKGFRWAPVLMGACRVGVYAMGAWSVTETPSSALFIGAAALWAYVVGLTYVARFETGSAVTKVWVAGLVFLPAVAAVWLLRADAALVWLAAGVAWLLHVAWSARAIAIVRSTSPGRIPRAVVALIAGISLVDATLLAATGWPLASGLAGLAFLLTLWGQRYVAGT